MPRLAVFDLDGTLIDSVADIAAAVNAALAELGYPTHPLAPFYDFVGEGVEHLITCALAPAPFDRAVLERYRQRYASEMTRRTQVYPGIAQTLAELQAQGCLLAVLSNKPHPATCALVTHFFADVAFAAVAGQKPEVPRKPDPSAALQIAAQLGVAPTDCSFVGDTAIDVQTGRNAGMRTIGVTWGFRPAEVAQADAVVDDATGLLQALMAV